jgi:hypothetical protein
LDHTHHNHFFTTNYTVIMHASIALVFMLVSATMAADTISFYFPAGQSLNLSHQIGHY